MQRTERQLDERINSTSSDDEPSGAHVHASAGSATQRERATHSLARTGWLLANELWLMLWSSVHIATMSNDFSRSLFTTGIVLSASAMGKLPPLKKSHCNEHRITHRSRPPRHATCLAQRCTAPATCKDKRILAGAHGSRSPPDLHVHDDERTNGSVMTLQWRHNGRWRSRPRRSAIHSLQLWCSW
jgi:hypothetical protein